MTNRTGANGLRLNGSGVSVAVIDSGIDPTHPFFRKRAVVANLKSLCADESNTDPSCVVRVPNNLDTDTASGGGHGTHVSGIVAGRPVTLTDGTQMQGAAPGAKLVSISTGAVLLIVGADAALNWVLENHSAPCGPGIPVATCPPIKVTNNSYGPIGGGSFDPRSATVKLQRALLLEGVVTVWAAGNDGGDGSESLTNPPGRISRAASSRSPRTSTATPARAPVRSASTRRGQSCTALDMAGHLGTGRGHHLIVPADAADLLVGGDPATVPRRPTLGRSTRSAERRWRHRTSPASPRSCSRPIRRRRRSGSRRRSSRRRPATPTARRTRSRATT
ncbi:MAG: S8 family serine peptidase [Ilumatobacteraceae bacterium]